MTENDLIEVTKNASIKIENTANQESQESAKSTSLILSQTSASGTSMITSSTFT